jgi:hypothetical protein
MLYANFRHSLGDTYDSVSTVINAQDGTDLVKIYIDRKDSEADEEELDGYHAALILLSQGVNKGIIEIDVPGLPV